MYLNSKIIYIFAGESNYEETTPYYIVKGFLWQTEIIKISLKPFQ